MSLPPNGPQQFPPAQYPPAPAPVAKKKTKKWPWVLGAIVLLIVIVSATNGGKTDTAPAAGATTPPAAAPAAQQPAKAAGHTVIYEVTGAGTASNITYTTDGMTSTEQVGNAPLPWSKTIELPNKSFQMVSLMAQAGDGTPEISAKITVDGKVIKDGKSTGQFAVVSVNDTVK
jgi:hypothetical protein